MYTKGIVSVHSVLFGFVLFKKKSRFSKIKIKIEGKKTEWGIEASLRLTWRRAMAAWYCSSYTANSRNMSDPVFTSAEDTEDPMVIIKIHHQSGCRF
jgi:hypothetical protein